MFVEMAENISLQCLNNFDDDLDNLCLKVRAFAEQDVNSLNSLEVDRSIERDIDNLLCSLESEEINSVLQDITIESEPETYEEIKEDKNTVEAQIEVLKENISDEIKSTILKFKKVPVPNIEKLPPLQLSTAFYERLEMNRKC